MATHLAGLEISRYADGELAPEPTARLEAHLAVCADCRARVRAELLVGADLRAHFAAAGSDLSVALPRRTWRPLRYAAVAAAALIMGIVVAPRLTGDLNAPQSPAGAVNEYTLYVAAGRAGRAAYTTVQGFVVASGSGRLSVRVGAQIMRVDLPAGYSSSQYPVGCAVVVHGLSQGPDRIEAAAIQRIAP